MQNKPGTTVQSPAQLKPLVENDWTTLMQAFEISDSSKRAQSIESVITYLHKEGRLGTVINACTEFTALAEQYDSSHGNQLSGSSGR